MIRKRTRASHRGKQAPVEKVTKQAALDMLLWANAVGDIDVYFLDE